MSFNFRNCGRHGPSRGKAPRGGEREKMGRGAIGRNMKITSFPQWGVFIYKDI